MRLQMTVVRVDTASEPLEVEVACARGATAADLEPALRGALGVEALGGVRVGGRRLAGSEPVGRGPLVDGAVLAVGGASRVADSPGDVAVHTSALSLAVVGGPDSGRSFDIRAGTLRIGRAGDADLVVDDPDLSRVHAELAVGPDGVTLRDCGSTNGSSIDGRRLGGEPEAITTASLVTLGSSRFRLRAPTARPAAVSSARDGVRQVNRSPRIHREAAPVTLTLPPLPDPPARGRMPWVAMLAPLPAGAILAVLFSPSMLVFTLMTPLLMLASAVSDRFTGRRSYAARLAEHAAAAERVATAAAAAIGEEQRRKRWALPDSAELLTFAATPSTRLWERRRSDPDMLLVRVGTWTSPSQTRVVTLGSDTPPRQPEAVDVPCPVSLAQLGVFGVAGPREATVAVVRSVLGQVATLHSPQDVRLWVLAADASSAQAWHWVSRLPHSRVVSGDASPPTQAAVLDGSEEEMAAAVRQLQRVVAHRQALRGPGQGASPGERIVVLLDGVRRLRAVPGLAALLEEGPALGMAFIALDLRADRLPAESGAVLEVSDEPDRCRLRSRTGDEGHGLVVDRVGPWWSERLSRALAPLRDATPEPDGRRLPPTARLLDLMPFDALDPAQVAQRWQASASATRAVVGVGLEGPHHIDLRADGPHILVGGTTGSGKSELLQSLIASLAVLNRPDRLCFVLVDYKGGAAFKECADLPHTAGLVTDLDAHLTQRALTSLTAELRRRESLFAAVGARDLDEYEASLAAEARHPSVPRLVLVVDEFRVLAEELPAFLSGLVRIAAVGRSLGVHLVLATQRPAGVISSDIKANVNLRIALRVRDRVDSEDVVDAPDAARLSERTPGRALARTGGGDLEAFQCARIGGVTPERHGAVQLTVTPLRWPHPPVGRTTSATSGSGAPGAGSTPSDLQRLAASLARACELASAKKPRPPWLPPLPERLPRHALTERAGQAGLGKQVGLGEQAGLSEQAGRTTPPTSPWQLPLGLADRPGAQVQDLLCWDLREPGHWAAIGSGASGRTSLVRLVAVTAAERLSPAEIHLYAVDGGGGGLRALELLPHTGAVVGHDDRDRLARLLRRLCAEVSRRQRSLAERGSASLAEWQGSPANGPAGSVPAHLLLLVDGWEQVAQSLDAHDHGALTDELLRLVRDGGSVGLRVLLTGSRDVLLGRTGSLFAQRLLLHQDDSTAAVMAGLTPASLPSHQPPGRAMLAGEGTEVQLAWLGVGPEQAAALQRAGAASAADAARLDAAQLPLRVDELPCEVGLSAMVPPAGGADGVLVGLGGDELVPLTLRPDRDGRRWLVAGGSRSGKSTALATLTQSLLDAGTPVAVVADRPGPLDRLRDHTHVVCWARPHEPSDVASLVAARQSHAGLAVIVDDADQTLDSPADPVLREIARLVERDAGLVVCSATASIVMTQYRGVAVEVARHQTGILLGPSGPAEGELFGTKVARVRDRIPGRGLLIARGATTPVQVARVEPTDTPGPRS
ncbi:MAG TPA: FtsK/SpoIIIE domain-containing protein [Pedococcus sp.]|nr:FtsK/SpoIIIE domain-containing protein [Pedococcus sp.]